MQSGNLDECGVCNGLSNTCAIEVQLDLSVNSSIVYGNGVSVREGPAARQHVHLPVE